MDSITQAIITALVRGLHQPVTGTDREAKTLASVQYYNELKAALSQKFGKDSDLVTAVEQLEKKPESIGRREVLKEEMAAVEADEDIALRAMARMLFDSLEEASVPPADPPTVPSATRRIPLQRPARVNYFAGRETELNYLLSNLRPDTIVALHGPGGIGKSALTHTAIWKLAPHKEAPEIFPDGIVYYDFNNQARVDMALAAFARAFGEEPMPTAYDAAQRILAEKKALLVLDGVEQADDLAGLLALRGNCGVLMTSRQMLEIQNFSITWQTVPPLPSEESLFLLKQWREAQSLDKAAAGQLCELVGGSPLAIRLIGHYLLTTQETEAEYLSWLSQTELAEMSAAERQTRGISLVIEHSLAQVNDSARQILGIVGLLALAPFDEKAITRALTIRPQQGLFSSIKGIFKQKSDQKSPDIKPTLQALINYGLLYWVGQHPRITHPLVHAYARQQLTTTEEVVRQVATYYTALAWRQSALGSDGYERLDAERPHLLKILGECLARKDWEAAHGLAAAIEDYLDRQGYLIERVIANEAGLVAAWQLGHPSEGAWLGNLGDTYRTMGHAKWAIEHFKKALDTARQEGDPYGQGNSLGNLGLAYRDLGQIDQARDYLQQSQAIFERVNSPSADLVREWLLELDEWDE